MTGFQSKRQASKDLLTPLPEPDGWAGKDWYHRPATTHISKFELEQARYTADQMHAYAKDRNAALQKQLNAANAIIKGQNERSIHRVREHGVLMQRAADVEGEREANAILTDENDRLRYERDLLRIVVAGTAAADELLETPEAIFRLARIARDALGETK